MGWSRPEPYPLPLDPTPEPRPWRRALGPLAVLAALAFKLKWLAALAKLKFVGSGLSMLVSVGAYALIWGWSFAVGFVLLLFVHELGHVLQLRREGVKASAPMFIPFLGAVIMARSLGRDAAAEARVGLAGPVLGSLAALVPVGLWLLTGDELFQALAFTAFLLNLFNLLPVLPLDGGRAMAALSPWMWVAGMAMLVASMLLFFSPILLLVLVFGGMETWRRFRARKDPEQAAYLRVAPRTRALVAATYIGLAVALGVGMDLTSLEREI
jgi:Zn-dependent protease